MSPFLTTIFAPATFVSAFAAAATLNVTTLPFVIFKTGAFSPDALPYKSAPAALSVNIRVILPLLPCTAAVTSVVKAFSPASALNEVIRVLASANLSAAAPVIVVKSISPFVKAKILDVLDLAPPCFTL